MSTQVLLVVLFAAVLHALWNAAVKASVRQRLPSAAIFIGAGVVAGTIVPFVPAPARESWPFLWGSVAVHCAYSIMLGHAYRLGDFSLAYPLMRGLPPLLTALIVAAFTEERMTLAQQAGMFVLCCGVLSLALEAGIASPGRSLRAAGWALMVAVAIGIYTSLDGFGGRSSGTVVGYIAWLCMLEGVCLAALVAARQGPATLLVILRSWKVTILGGLTTLVSYALVIWAMTQAPIPVVAALRETSVVFAALLGVAVFGERLGPVRILAIALVMGGIFLMRLY
ncbi:MAG: DMT family transporter [Pseudomonadota bacterium]|nr:DMT family transporter [Pseudomonadota bacterium]